jgi:hypothetical protein
MRQEASVLPRLSPAILHDIRRALLSDLDAWQLFGLRHVPWMTACLVGAIVNVLPLTLTSYAAFAGYTVGTHAGLRRWLAWRPAFGELARFDCRPSGHECDEQTYWRCRRRRDLLHALRGAIGTPATRIGVACGYGALVAGALRTV